MDKPTSWPWDPAPTSKLYRRVRGQQLLDNTASCVSAQAATGQAPRRTLAFGVGAFRQLPAPVAAADTQDDVSAELAQLRDSVLGPLPPWGTFTDTFAGAELIGASHGAACDAADLATVQQGAPRLRAAALTDSVTHSGVTQEDALEVTSGAMKRRRETDSEPLVWEFSDGGTTMLTHEEITIDTDLDGGVHMVALVGSVTATTEERAGGPPIISTATGSAEFYVPRADSPRGPHDWDEAMLGDALAPYPVRFVQPPSSE